MKIVLVCLLAGMGAGIGTGLAGMSAAAVITPMLIAFFNMPAYEAVGIALASDVLASAVSAYTYKKNKNLDVKNGLVMMSMVLVFTMVGSFVSSIVPNKTMSGMSMAMTFFLGLKFLIKPVMTSKEVMGQVSAKKRLIQSLISGMVIGFICGFVGAGGGMMMLLVLTSVLGYELKTAVGTSVFIMAFTALTGALSHFVIGGLPDVKILIACVVFTLIWARIAALFANKASAKVLNRVLGLVLMILGLVIILVSTISGRAGAKTDESKSERPQSNSGREVTMEEVKEEYQDLLAELYDITGTVTGSIERVVTITRDRNIYKQGLKLIDEGHYLDAIKYFERVSDTDSELNKQAIEKAKEAKKAYTKEKNDYLAKTDETVSELIRNKNYEEAKNLINEGLAIYPDEGILVRRKTQIEDLIAASLVSRWTTSYNMGSLIASDLGVSGYKLYFPVELVFDFVDDRLNVYVKKDSIKPAIDDLTQDEESMEAIYSVAEQYGLNKRQADFIIKFTYGGSYSDFITDYFKKDIDQALADFSYSGQCYVTKSRIYLGSSEVNNNHYLDYYFFVGGVAIDGYRGNDKTLKLLAYPLELNVE